MTENCHDETTPIQQAKARWLEQCRKEGQEPLVPSASLSRIPITALYTPSDLRDFDYLRDLGFPGDAPYTRGTYATMYRGRTWTMRQLAGLGTAEDTNERLRFLLDQGATGVNVTFDYPTLRGYDSTDPEAEADVGRGGVAIDSLLDMEAVFDGVPVDELSVSLVTCNPIVAVSLLPMYFVAAERRGVELKELSGTTQNDFLMETAITVAPRVLSPRHSFKLSCDLIEFCVQRAPKWNPVSYAGYNYREAGVDAVQEVAFALSNAISCVKELTRRGWDIDLFAPRLSFFLSAHNDFFEEIAKYRAARRVWYKIMKERFQPQNPRSCNLRFHVQTAGSCLTAQQPLNNITRAAYHALAAILGGAQSVHVDAYDEALCTPTEASAMVALRTQQVLLYETNVTSTIDPLGGSYFVEYLTNEVETRVCAYLEEIEQKGGIVAATEKGWTHREILNSALATAEAMAKGALKVVGVNCFAVEEQAAIDTSTTPETLARQKVKLDKLRNLRNPSEVGDALARLRLSCRKGDNVVPAVVDAVSSLATIGEITNVLVEEFGTWGPPLA